MTEETIKKLEQIAAKREELRNARMEHAKEVKELQNKFDELNGIGEPIKLECGCKIGYACAINFGTRDNPKIAIGWSAINLGDVVKDKYDHTEAKYIATKRAFKDMELKSTGTRSTEIVPYLIRKYLEEVFIDRVLRMYFSDKVKFAIESVTHHKINR